MGENKKDGVLLYYNVVSSFSRKVLIGFHEKKIEWTGKSVSLKDSEQLESWFLKLNPKVRIRDAS